jgi:RNA methyltransferase, TrmH family
LARSRDGSEATSIATDDEPVTNTAGAGVDIASPANPRLKAAVRLRDRQERDRTARTIVDGAREIGRAVDGGAHVVEAYVCEPLLTSVEARGVVSRLRTAGTVILTTSPVAFRKIAFGERSDGVVAIVEVPAMDIARLALPDDPLVLVVEGVEKPGNLGAILRTADGAGADAVIAASPLTDVFNPNTIRASLGTVFTVPVATAETQAVTALLRRRAIRIVAARVDADALYTDVDLRGAVAVVVGSEAGGLSKAWSGSDVTAVRLPMLGDADSLNVSAAAAILLYEARRQRGIPRVRPRVPRSG